MTEVVITNVKTGRVVVNAVLIGHAFVKNKVRRIIFRGNIVFSEGSVPEVHMAEELLRQIEDAGFRQTDIFIEYNTAERNTLNVLMSGFSIASQKED